MIRATAAAVRTADSAGWRRARLVLELAVLALILLDFGRIVVALIALDAPLHWDEAVYAVRARSWLDPDVPLSGWSHIRPPLLPLIAGLPVLAGGDEWQLRSIGLIAGVATLLAVWWLGRMIAGPLAGLLAAAILHGSPTLQKESATLLTDVPAAALLLVLAGLLWHQLEERPRLGNGLVVAAAIASLAFFMRYGSVLVVVPLLTIAVLLWWRRLHAAPPVAAVLVGVVAIGGHVAWSLLQTGAPLGILIDAQNVVSEGGSPYREYRSYIPFTLAGSVGSLAIRLGVVALPAAAVAAALRPAWSRELRAALFLVVPAAAHVYLLTRGVGHAEERFFILSTALLVIAGSCAAALLVRTGPAPVRLGLVAAAAVALVLARGDAVEHSLRRTVQTANYYAQFEVVGRAIAAAAGPDCGIVGGGYPILAWYSRCETDRLRVPADGGPPGLNLVADERWAVLSGAPRDIDWDAPVPAAVQAAAVGEPVVITDPASGDVIGSAWRLDVP